MSTPAVPYTWIQEYEEAFKELKQKLTTAPFLGYPEFYSGNGRFQSWTLGSVMQDGVPRVIAYGSRGLAPAETKYPAHKLEYLELKWAVTEKLPDEQYTCTARDLKRAKQRQTELANTKVRMQASTWKNIISHLFCPQTSKQGGHCLFSSYL